MATAKDLRRIALSLTGTMEAPHFDRTAFRVARIYATLAADGRTANLMFAPDEQEFKCDGTGGVRPGAERLGQAWRHHRHIGEAQGGRASQCARNGLAPRRAQGEVSTAVT
jgi:hypothetical protein